MAGSGFELYGSTSANCCCVLVPRGVRPQLPNTVILAPERSIRHETALLCCGLLTYKTPAEIVIIRPRRETIHTMQISGWNVTAPNGNSGPQVVSALVASLWAA